MGIFGIGRFFLSIYCAYKEKEAVYLGIFPGIKKSRFGTMKNHRGKTTLKSTGFVLGFKRRIWNRKNEPFFLTP